MAKKLDRALANLQWRLGFPEAFVEVLCRLHSNHNPLLLRLGGIPQPRGPKRFRFEAAWIMHKDYQEVVHSAGGKEEEDLWRLLTRLDIIPSFSVEMFLVTFLEKREI